MRAYTKVFADLILGKIKDHFKQAGAVLRADIPTKGRGAVSFGSTREAAKAIQLFNDSTFLGRKIEVVPS